MYPSTLLASLSLPLLASATLSPLHLSHRASSGRHAGRGLRHKRTAQAYVKCDSLYTFSLCGTDSCESMGSVADGTQCVDGAIVSVSSSAGASETVTVSTAASWTSSVATSSAVWSSSTAAASSNKAKSSSFTSAPASSWSASSSSSSSSSIPSTTSTWFASATATTSPWTSTTPSSTWTPSSTSAAATTSSSTSSYVQLTTTSTWSSSAAPTTTSTSPAAATTTSASSSSSGSGSSSDYTGTGTFFYQEGGTGACGQAHSDDDYLVAVAEAYYSSDMCGKQVTVTNTANSKSVKAYVADMCPGCVSKFSLDLSVATFDSIGDEATGTLDISWCFDE